MRRVEMFVIASTFLYSTPPPPPPAAAAAAALEPTGHDIISSSVHGYCAWSKQAMVLQGGRYCIGSMRRNKAKQTLRDATYTQDVGEAVMELQAGSS